MHQDILNSALRDSLRLITLQGLSRICSSPRTLALAAFEALTPFFPFSWVAYQWTWPSCTALYPVNGWYIHALRCLVMASTPPDIRLASTSRYGPENRSISTNRYWCSQNIDRALSRSFLLMPHPKQLKAVSSVNQIWGNLISTEFWCSTTMYCPQAALRSNCFGQQTECSSRSGSNPSCALEFDATSRSWPSSRCSSCCPNLPSLALLSTLLGERWSSCPSRWPRCACFEHASDICPTSRTLQFWMHLWLFGCATSPGCQRWKPAADLGLYFGMAIYLTSE